MADRQDVELFEFLDGILRPIITKMYEHHLQSEIEQTRSEGKKR